MSENKTFAIIALIVSFILPVVGLILGIVALSKINKTSEKKGKALAIASIIIGAILTLIIVLLVILPMIMYYNIFSPVSHPTLLPEADRERQSQIEQEIDSVSIPKLDNPTPGICAFSTGISCIEFSLSREKFSIIIKNDGDSTINIEEFLVYEIDSSKPRSERRSLRCDIDKTVEVKHSGFALIELENCDFVYDSHVFIEMDVRHTLSGSQIFWATKGSINARFN